MKKAACLILIVALTTFISCLPAKAQLKIDKVYCGADGSWRDVTMFLTNAVTNDTLTMVVTQPYEKIGGDPAMDRIKKMLIDYHFNGQPFRLLLDEQNGFKIELPSSKAAAPGADSRATATMASITTFFNKPPLQVWEPYLACFAFFASLISIICVIITMVQIRHIKADLKGTVIVRGE